MPVKFTGIGSVQSRHGGHWFSNAKFHKSTPGDSVAVADNGVMYFIDHLRTVRFPSGTVVQTPHFRVMMCDIDGSISTVRDDNGQPVKLKTSAKAYAYAKALASGEDPTTEKPRKSAVRKCQDALIEAEKRRLDSAIQGKAGQS